MKAEPLSVVDKDFNKETMKSLIEFRKMGATIPKTVEELQERITKYFEYCDNTGYKPGVESLALACGVVRQTFLRWETGENRPDFAPLCQYAKQTILAWLENAAVNGKINPVTYIFQSKCNFGYEEKSIVEHRTQESVLLGADQLPKLDSKKRFEEWKRQKEEESKVIDAEFVEIRPAED